jgi:hypothetical protein
MAVRRSLTIATCPFLDVEERDDLDENLAEDFAEDFAEELVFL